LEKAQEEPEDGSGSSTSTVKPEITKHGKHFSRD
jgi:hypothetical protein